MTSLMMPFVLLSLTFSLAQEREPASALKVELGQSLRLIYGGHQKDEILFKNNGGHYLFQWVNREPHQKTVEHKRALPKEIAEKKLFELGYLISRYKVKMESFPGCSSTLQLERSGKGLKKSEAKAYCLDALTPAHDRDLASWIETTTELFRL